MGIEPVCYVCSAEDASVSEVPVGIVATRQGLKSPQARSQTFLVKVCDRCWGKASLPNMAMSIRASDQQEAIHVDSG